MTLNDATGVFDIAVDRSYTGPVQGTLKQTGPTTGDPAAHAWAYTPRAQKTELRLGKRPSSVFSVNASAYLRRQVARFLNRCVDGQHRDGIGVSTEGGIRDYPYPLSSIVRVGDGEAGRRMHHRTHNPFH